MAELDLLLQRLTAAQFQFVLVGAFAAVLHGASVVTRDVDVRCSFDADNLIRLRAALAGLHPTHRMTPQRLPLEITEANAGTFRNLYIQTDIGPLGCLSEIAAVGDYKVVSERCVKFSLSWGVLGVLDLDALIAVKSALNRLQDKIAIPQLLAIKERHEHGNDANNG